MRLPCRQCSDPMDTSTFIPMSACVPLKAAVTYHKTGNFDEVWLSSIALGADLTCLNCRMKLGEKSPAHQCDRGSSNRIVFCNDCCTTKLASEFSEDMQEQGQKTSLSAHISCKVCTGEQSKIGRPVMDKLVLYTCAGAGCSTEEKQLAWPKSHFLEDPPELLAGFDDHRTPPWLGRRPTPGQNWEFGGLRTEFCGLRTEC